MSRSSLGEAAGYTFDCADIREQYQQSKRSAGLANGHLQISRSLTDYKFVDL